MAKTLYGSFTVAAYKLLHILCQLQIELNFISLVIENVKIINKYVLVKVMNI